MTTRTDETKGAAPVFPLRLGGAEDFARVESLLKLSGFDEATICRMLDLGEMADLSSVKPEQVDLSKEGSATLAVLIRIFLFSQPIPRADVEQLIDAATLESLVALDVFRIGAFGADTKTEMYYSPVFLYPVEGLLIASDRHNNPDGSAFFPPPDIVFPAINAGSLSFLRIIPKTPTASVLDLCSGSGVAALALNNCSERVVASDITARATHFADFNRLLNRCSRVEVRQGDLYASVEGEMFDRIVAHPPYVPSLSKTVIYRDGGETGETLVRRIIEKLPAHLRPGGTYYSICVGLDTDEGGFEQRVRTWLGESQDEFDVIFAFSDERSPARFVREVTALTRSEDPSEIGRWDDLFSSIGARKLVYGALVIHRKAEESDAGAGRASQPLTARPRLSASTDGASFEWALDWHHWRSRPDSGEEISNATPRLAPFLRVKVIHRVRDNQLVPAEFMLESDKPFVSVTKVDPWIVPLIAEFDGQRSTAELYQAARDVSALPESFSLGDFIGMVAILIERGYLEIDGDILDAQRCY